MGRSSGALRVQQVRHEGGQGDDPWRRALEEMAGEKQNALCEFSRLCQVLLDIIFTKGF